VAVEQAAGEAADIVCGTIRASASIAARHKLRQRLSDETVADLAHDYQCGASWAELQRNIRSGAVQCSRF
jgi:predicted dinucleotide-binding enzyme